MTKSAPIDGTKVDSSPVDHRTRRKRADNSNHDSIVGSLADLC